MNDPIPPTYRAFSFLEILKENGTFSYGREFTVVTPIEFQKIFLLKEIKTEAVTRCNIEWGNWQGVVIRQLARIPQP